MPESDLMRAAGRITDGYAVDWAELARAASPDEQRLLRQLEAIERLVRLHTPARAAAPSDPLDPSARWGPLVILEDIGAGSYGEVYRALDPRLNRQVALKLLKSDGDEGALVREAYLLSRVRHPNVVGVYGAERIDGRTGLWMEFVGGVRLDRELARTGHLPEQEVARIGLELADALDAVHRAGLLHRDIKPQNVMRASDGRLVLMDFGTGQEVSAEGAQPLAGTPLYVAPEVFAGRPASVSSDIYSLGVLLWHAATGTFPVPGSTLGQLREAHAARGLTARVPPGVSAGLGRLLACATHADPRQRYADAPAMRAALLRLVDRPGVGRRAWLALAGVLLAALALRTC